MICALKKDDALAVWPFVEPLIKKATDRDKGRTTPETFRQDIERDEAVLWVTDDLSLACITAIVTHPTGLKACVVQACGGEDMEKCKELCELLADYAKTIDCDLLEIYGREGWLRTLPNFTKDVVAMSREL